MSARTTTKTHIVPSCLLLALLPAFSGCALRNGDGADEFREAIPAQRTVALAGPETQTESEAGGSRLQAEGDPAPSGDWAQFYAFTRKTRDDVNAVTAVVLGSVWIVVHTRPTDVWNDQATWGPWTDDLSPATYRFVVSRIEASHYEYRLEGKPKTAGDDQYRAVLVGDGYGKDDDRHGDGSFNIDLDVAHELDPFKNPDVGQLRIEHDLPRDITTHLGALPRTVTADASSGEATWSVTSYQEPGGGTLLTTAHADLDDSKATLLEDIEISSRWNSDGAGRADVTIAGGDVAAAIGQPVTAIECWGGDFTRVYYNDTQGFQPTEGDVTACAF